MIPAAGVRDGTEMPVFLSGIDFGGVDGVDGAPGAVGAGGSEQPAGAALPQQDEGAQSQLLCLREAKRAFNRSSRPGLSQESQLPLHPLLQPVLQPVSLQLVVQPWKMGLLNSGVPQAGLQRGARSHFGAFSQHDDCSQPQSLFANLARMRSNRLALPQVDWLQPTVGPQPLQPPQPEPETTAGVATAGAATGSAPAIQTELNRRIAFTGNTSRRTGNFNASDPPVISGLGRAV